jgi:hypothetical protein
MLIIPRLAMKNYPVISHLEERFPIPFQLHSKYLPSKNQHRLATYVAKKRLEGGQYTLLSRLLVSKGQHDVRLEANARRLTSFSPILFSPMTLRHELCLGT